MTFAEAASSADIAGIDAVVGMTFLANPIDVVADGMTFQDGCGDLDGSVCDCGDCCDESPGYWNDDNQGDCDA